MSQEQSSQYPKEHTVRAKVPYSGEVVWALRLRNQTGFYLRNDGISTHPIPETSAQLDRAMKYTSRLKDLMEDPILGYKISSSLMQIADSMMANGEITETQYLSVVDTHRMVSLGESYTPLEAPHSYIMEYGSINNDLNREPLYPEDSVSQI